MIELFKTNRGFRIAAILVIVQAVLITVIAAFRLGGEEFVNNLFDLLSPVYAVIAVLSTFWGWKISNTKEISRRIWGWMTAGLLLWAIAELLWIFYAIQYHDTTPYPSPADLFWLIGYIPMFAAFIMRLRSFHVGLNRRQITWLVAINAMFFILSAHSILWPMIQNYESARWLESTVNILYAVCDLAMLAISLWIILGLQKGRYSFVWWLVAGSNIIRSIADLIFTYATWHQASLGETTFYVLYVIFNIPYLSSYLILALGMVVYYEFLASSHKEDNTKPLRPDESYSTALIFTNAENYVVGASYNFAELIGADSLKELKHRPLYELLGVEASAVTSMMEAGGQKGYISEFPLEIRTSGQGRTRAWLTATSDRWSGNAFNGLNIALRMRAGEPNLAELDSESSAIAQRILADTGQLSQEKMAMLTEYFRTLVLGLYVLVDNLAGKAVTLNMLDNFNGLAAHNHWPIQFDQQRFQLPDDFKEDQLGNAFRHLLKNLKDYGVEVLNAQVITDEIKKIERRLGSRVVQTAEDFGLRNI